ncbi:hypothetical protein M5689_003515 [Euphorbia peplus]|nr:hypothetical protein M5689_003515 [Euphorbia peplus]
MNAAIIDMMKKITLIEDEKTVVKITKSTPSQTPTPAKPSLLGKVISNKPLNLSSLASAFMGAWKIKTFQIKDLGDELFLCEFESKKEKDKIFNEGPWHYERHLVVLRELPENTLPTYTSMKWCDLWVRMIHIPFKLRDPENLYKVASGVGKVKYLEEGELCLLRSSVRARISINISKPIPRVVLIEDSQGNIFEIPLKYEKLPSYCYWCGFFDHVNSECESVPEDFSGVDWTYGKALRATPLRFKTVKVYGGTSRVINEMEENKPPTSRKLDFSTNAKTLDAPVKLIPEAQAMEVDQALVVSMTVPDNGGLPQAITQQQLSGQNSKCTSGSGDRKKSEAVQGRHQTDLPSHEGPPGFFPSAKDKLEHIPPILQYKIPILGHTPNAVHPNQDMLQGSSIEKRQLMLPQKDILNNELIKSTSPKIPLPNHNLVSSPINLTRPDPLPHKTPNSVPSPNTDPPQPNQTNCSPNIHANPKNDTLHPLPQLATIPDTILLNTTRTVAPRTTQKKSTRSQKTQQSNPSSLPNPPPTNPTPKTNGKRKLSEDEHEGMSSPKKICFNDKEESAHCSASAGLQHRRSP